MKKFLILVFLLTAAMLYTGCGADDEKRFTLDELLYDFDYMVQLMEDTFPYFGVVERRFGIDIRELIRETRELIADYPHSLYYLAEQNEVHFENLPCMDEFVFFYTSPLRDFCPRT